MTLAVASAWNFVPLAEPSGFDPADSEPVTELGTVDASSLPCQIGSGNSSEQKASPSATSFPECSEIGSETWQHCQTIVSAKLVQEISSKHDASTTHARFVIRLKALGFQITTLWTA